MKKNAPLLQSGRGAFYALGAIFIIFIVNIQ